MTTGGPYRSETSPKEALGILRDLRGSQFDRHIVDVFAAVFRKAPVKYFLALCCFLLLYSQYGRTARPGTGDHQRGPTAWRHNRSAGRPCF